jgi:dolichol kinase
MATVIGEKFGKRKAFNKSLEGSLACLSACLLIGIVMATVNPTLVISVAIVGAVSAMIVEFLPLPIDDNFTIPLFSGGIMTLTEFYFA